MVASLLDFAAWASATLCWLRLACRKRQCTIVLSTARCVAVAALGEGLCLPLYAAVRRCQCHHHQLWSLSPFAQVCVSCARTARGAKRALRTRLMHMHKSLQASKYGELFNPPSSAWHQWIRAPTHSSLHCRAFAQTKLNDQVK